MNHTWEIRHDLHQHPGVSGQEQYAHDLILQELSTLHVSEVHAHVGGYGVIAVWGNNPQAPTIGFRADIDALPIGHRCGHDGHAAILLNLAQLVDVAVSNGQYEGVNIVLVWQPEEETGSGSRKVLEANILQKYNMKAIYGFHNLPGYDEGVVLLNRNTFAAASAGVTYHLKGRPTHASTPELGVNPGLAVAELIQQIAKCNSGAVADQRQFRQTTFIGVRAGSAAFGTAAGDADVMFTLRAFANETMDDLLASAHALVQSVAERHGLEFGYTICDPFRATENDGQAVERVERCLKDRDVTIRYAEESFRWSEDFSNYLELFPGAMVGIGAGKDHVELHHPEYEFPDAIIEPAAKMLFRLINTIFI